MSGVSLSTDDNSAHWSKFFLVGCNCLVHYVPFSLPQRAKENKLDCLVNREMFLFVILMWWHCLLFMQCPRCQPERCAGPLQKEKETCLSHLADSNSDKFLSNTKFLFSLHLLSYLHEPTINVLGMSGESLCQYHQCLTVAAGLVSLHRHVRRARDGDRVSRQIRWPRSEQLLRFPLLLSHLKRKLQKRL